jgi:hypothetical protein
MEWRAVAGRKMTGEPTRRARMVRGVRGSCGWYCREVVGKADVSPWLTRVAAVLPPIDLLSSSISSFLLPRLPYYFFYEPINRQFSV